MTRRRTIRLLILSAALAALPLSASASAASAAGAYYHDNAWHHGARAGLSFQSGNLPESGRILRDVDGIVQLPRSWANRYCARAVVLINGMPADAQPRQCDTNGDALLSWQFRDLELLAGDRATLWISDPVTRYRVTHPAVTVR